MRHIFVAGMLLTFTGFVFAQSIDVNSGSDDGHPSLTSALTSTLHEKRWNHGSSDCKSNTDPAIEVFRYDQSSFILRQNKCLSFEAPFLYVLLGNEKALVLDTGATKSALDFPLYETGGRLSASRRCWCFTPIATAITMLVTISSKGNRRSP